MKIQEIPPAYLSLRSNPNFRGPSFTSILLYVKFNTFPWGTTQPTSSQSNTMWKSRVFFTEWNASSRMHAHSGSTFFRTPVTETWSTAIWTLEKQCCCSHTFTSMSPERLKAAIKPKTTLLVNDLVDKSHLLREHIQTSSACVRKTYFLSFELHNVSVRTSCGEMKRWYLATAKECSMYATIQSHLLFFFSVRIWISDLAIL